MPDKPVVAIVGDGAFLINGMEVTTTVNYNIPLFEAGAAGFLQKPFQHTELLSKVEEAMAR